MRACYALGMTRSKAKKQAVEAIRKLVEAAKELAVAEDAILAEPHVALGKRRRRGARSRQTRAGEERP